VQAVFVNYEGISGRGGTTKAPKRKKEILRSDGEFRLLVVTSPEPPFLITGLRNESGFQAHSRESAR